MICQVCGKEMVYDEGEYDGDSWTCYECLKEVLKE